MSNPISRNGKDVWRRLTVAYNAYRMAMREFSAPSVDRVGMLKTALRGAERNVAMDMLRYLDICELEGLFEELVFLASFSHGAIQHIRNQILRLPHEWVLSRIEGVAEPLLADGTYDEYRRLLELYALLDPGLTRRLAERAMRHSDPDIKEAGQDFLA